MTGHRPLSAVGGVARRNSSSIGSVAPTQRTTAPHVGDPSLAPVRRPRPPRHRAHPPGQQEQRIGQLRPRSHRHAGERAHPLALQRRDRGPGVRLSLRIERGGKRRAETGQRRRRGHRATSAGRGRSRASNTTRRGSSAAARTNTRRSTTKLWACRIAAMPSTAGSVASSAVTVTRSAVPAPTLTASPALAHGPAPPRPRPRHCTAVA
jgi:hypothetical protein